MIINQIYYILSNSYLDYLKGIGREAKKQKQVECCYNFKSKTRKIVPYLNIYSIKKINKLWILQFLDFEKKK